MTALVVTARLDIVANCSYNTGDWLSRVFLAWSITIGLRGGWARTGVRAVGLSWGSALFDILVVLKKRRMENHRGDGWLFLGRNAAAWVPLAALARGK